MGRALYFIDLSTDLDSTMVPSTKCMYLREECKTKSPTRESHKKNSGWVLIKEIANRPNYVSSCYPVDSQIENFTRHSGKNTAGIVWLY